jgi:hypothetical protein
MVSYAFLSVIKTIPTRIKYLYFLPKMIKHILKYVRTKAFKFISA